MRFTGQPDGRVGAVHGRDKIIIAATNERPFLNGAAVIVDLQNEAVYTPGQLLLSAIVLPTGNKVSEVLPET